MSGRRDSDVDALLGYGDPDDDSTPVGWWTWIFAACRAAAPVTIKQASRTLNKNMVKSDNERGKLQRERDDLIVLAKECTRAHMEDCGSDSKSVLTCECDAARTARIHLQNAENLKKRIRYIEAHFQRSREQQNALDTIGFINDMSAGMKQTSQAMSAELKKNNNSLKEIEGYQDSISESQLAIQSMQEALGMQFNMTTGVVNGLEVDESTFNELFKDLDDTELITTQQPAASSSYGAVDQHRPYREPEKKQKN